MSLWFVRPETRNVPTLLLLAVAIAFMGAALGLLRTAPADLRARYLALFFVTIASATAMSLLPKAASGAEGFPTRWLAALLPETFLPYFLWSFIERFPRASRYDRLGLRIRHARRVCLLVGLVLMVLNGAYRLGIADEIFGRSLLLSRFLRQTTSAYWLILFALALPAPLLALRRARDAAQAEQRRTRFFLVGLAIGLLPLFCGVLAELLVPRFNELMSQPGARRAGSAVVYGSLLTIPLTASLAVGARFFSLRPMAKQAARLALARSTLILLSLGATLGLILFFWIHRRRSLEWIVTSPTSVGLFLLAIMGPSLLGWRPLLLKLFASPGRGFDSEELLGSFARDAYSARDFRELEELAARAFNQLLRTPELRLLLRADEDGAEFRPVRAGCRPLAQDSLLVELLGSSGDPLPVDMLDPQSLAMWLPEEERQWLEETKTGLIVPLADHTFRTRGLLLLQRRQGLEPYDRDDLRIAKALATSIFLGSERLRKATRLGPFSVGADVSDEAVSECETCGTVADPGSIECACGGPLTPGVVPKLIRGNFRVERLIGVGGMGRVYLATDRTLARQVALKALPRLRTHNLARLYREAQAMASFVHPNLATIFGVESWQGIPVLVLELLAGGTLASQKEGRLSPTAAIELGIKLCSGLEAIHAKGLLHRDIKPSNIGFDATGEPKLLDFGLVEIVDQARIRPNQIPGISPSTLPLAQSVTDTHHVVGTPLYLSPEVLQGHKPTEAQDLWGLNLVLWETLAGYHPLSHLDQRTATEELRKNRLPSIHTARKDCPEALAALIDDGLAEPSRRRPRSACELRQRLRAALD